MNKLACTFFMIMSVSGTFLSAQSLDEVLQSHFTAVGQEKLLTIKSFRTQGKMIASGMSIPFSQWSQRPDCFRVESVFNGVTFLQTYNGKEGWTINPFAGITEPQALTADEMKSVKYNSDFDGMLWSWKEKGYTVTLEGTESTAGKSCFKIKLVTKEEDVFTEYIDVVSHLLIRTHSMIKTSNGDMESDTYFSNYMQVEGVAMPGKIETKIDGQVVNTLLTEKIEVNPELIKSLFNKPVQ
jgi:hypothetical protein